MNEMVLKQLWMQDIEKYELYEMECNECKDMKWNGIETNVNARHYEKYEMACNGMQWMCMCEMRHKMIMKWLWCKMLCAEQWNKW